MKQTNKKSAQSNTH